jgi:hypothetical protein
LFLILAVLPLPYLASPRWDVLVMTADHKPVAEVSVRLSYQNYSAESDSHEITLITKGEGHVLFPQQRKWTIPLLLLFHTAASATAGVHASFGRHAFVFIFGRRYEGQGESGKYVTDWNGSPAQMKSTIIARPQRD